MRIISSAFPEMVLRWRLHRKTCKPSVRSIVFKRGVTNGREVVSADDLTEEEGQGCLLADERVVSSGLSRLRLSNSN